MLEQNQNERWKGKVKNGDVSLFVSGCSIYLMSGWNSLSVLFSKKLFPKTSCSQLLHECSNCNLQLCGHAIVNLLNLFVMLISRKRKLDTSQETSSG